MRGFRLAVLALALLSAGLAARPASADLSLCSQYREALYAAYSYHDGTDWTTLGWYTIDPGQCTTVYTGALQNQYFYVYAYADDGSTWGGEYYFCTHWPNAFQIWGDDDCDVGFFEIDTAGAPDMSYTLTP